MGRALVRLFSAKDRQTAIGWIQRAPVGTRIEFKTSQRTTPQNDRMWAMLTVLAEKLTWHGIRLSTEDWKLIFMDALNREVRMVPNIDGTGFVNLGRSTSKLTKQEHSDLTMIIEAFAAKHGVDLGEQAA